MPFKAAISSINFQNEMNEYETKMYSYSCKELAEAHLEMAQEVADWHEAAPIALVEVHLARRVALVADGRLPRRLVRAAGRRRRRLHCTRDLASVISLLLSQSPPFFT